MDKSGAIRACPPRKCKKRRLSLLMAGVDATELARAAAQFPMPRASKSLRPYDHFAAMVFAQLTYRESLRRDPMGSGRCMLIFAFAVDGQS